MLPICREQFAKYFNEELEAQIKNGVEKNVAAALAIKKAKQLLASEAEASKAVENNAVIVPKNKEPTPPKVEIVLPKVDIKSIEEMLHQCSLLGSYSSAIRLCGKFYSSAEYLNASFVFASEIGINEVVCTNVIEIEAVYKLLFATNVEGIRNSIEHAIVGLSSDLVFCSKKFVKMNEITPIIIMLEHPLILEPSSAYRLLLKNVLLIIDNLPELMQRSLSIWFGSIGNIFPPHM